MVVVKLNWSTELVLDKGDAMTLVGILERAYKWESKYITKEKSETGEAHTLYFTYPNEEEYGMKIINDSIFNMAKLAGKPAKEA